MESHIQISKINDFLFCPHSVYLHSVYEKFSQKVYHSTPQTIGKICHQTIEEKRYTTSKWILQGMEVFSEKYGLIGKIDIFDTKSGDLIERKYKVKKIFDGYKYQLYAQMFCLEEMGYTVKNLFIHSLSDNKRYEIPLPDKNEINKFELLIEDINNYQASQKYPKNLNKCAKCIYKPLCH
ncbi:MAG: endonuclease [Parcubacteria group bacterium CG23_combo_of_CG06-09_8_20_14_all_35_9]|nr:MAG: endonuclease [Parcubacteria group bacterium CG23_combo_of_CG06-09_8_20_14_all_35_9]